MSDAPQPSEWDTCLCGDYRRDHQGGTGKCKLRWLHPDCGCGAFRLDQPFATQAEADAAHKVAMER